MTKKEAAEKLQQELKLLCHGCMHPQEVGWCKNHCKLPEAFDMAIEALTDTSNALDTIYRQAAIDEIEERINANSRGGNVALISELNRVEGYILHLQPVQQKPLKYTGDSICLYCQTADCDGCMYEPMEGYNK